jgi:hypothetical protein
MQLVFGGRLEQRDSSKIEPLEIASLMQAEPMNSLGWNATNPLALVHFNPHPRNWFSTHRLIVTETKHAAKKK